ncbi:myb-binding protein 1A-like protein [Electrophorus electricus]|uniref:myb-binding protein 1A-like protein n=1 Tax=Electrophorus electricus TaxID=8005 RepID=UPI0015CFCF4A|nr:myb-binding protein 1A-like protein [Electrophorus electricus]XP_035382167.1 myb-binding protein 1A-like protein [Electrophorus electricus]
MEQEAPKPKKKGFLPENKKCKKSKKLTVLENKDTTVAPATARGGVEGGKKKEEKKRGGEETQTPHPVKKAKAQQPKSKKYRGRDRQQVSTE